MKTKILFAFSLVVLIANNSCKKYPDDEQFMHLSSPQKRLTRYLWDSYGVVNYTTNKPAQAYTGSMSENIQFAANSFHGDVTPYFNYDGTWELSDKKKKIKITNGTTSIIETYTIQKLDKTELTFRDDSLEYYFKAHLIK